MDYCLYNPQQTRGFPAGTLVHIHIIAHPRFFRETVEVWTLPGVLAGPLWVLLGT